jgi:aminopeptidase N
MFDSISAEYLLANISDFTDPLLKGITWINMYENLVNGAIRPDGFFSAAMSDLQGITDLQLRNYLSGRLSSVWWNYMTDEERVVRAAETESMLRAKMISAESPAEKRSWFGTLRNITVSQKGLEYLATLWKTGEIPGNGPTGGVPGGTAPAGNYPGKFLPVNLTPASVTAGPVKLSEDELCTLALTLAMKGYPEAVSIIARQRERIAGRERLERFDFVTPAVSQDTSARDAFFGSLRDPANREREPWVLEALGYLHHPSVAESSEKYILPSLEMLEEIKSTGDIFFPGSWISTTLAGHSSPEARATVEKFLDDHPGYPADLKLKILQAADHLFRK